MNAIRFHLDGKIEVSADHGETWQDFEGMALNAALIEYRAELEHMKREQS